MTDSETLKCYADWAAKHAERYGRAAPDEQLSAFMAALPAGARVLDLGCGVGRAAAEMVARGFEVHAIDATPEFAAIARENYGLEIEIGTFEAVTAVDAYDGIFANFSLQHAPKSDMPGHLSRLARALNPGGFLHLAVTRGAGERRDKLGRFYAYYSEPELKGLLASEGFDTTRRWLGETRGMDGEMAPWIILHAVLRHV